MAVLAVTLFGSFGYVMIEGWPFHRSLFFTLITLTTVGYGDYGLSEMGERFTTILLIFGIGTVTFSAGQVVQAVIEIQIDKEGHVLKRIESLRNHYIICGAGDVGMAICDQLHDEKVEFVVIDNDEDNIEDARRRGYLAIRGNATDDETLFLAGIEHVSAIACATDSDTQNIVITLSAHELRPDIPIIARAEQDDSIKKIRRAGATRVISPRRTGGANFVDSILRPNLADLMEHSHTCGSGFQMAEVPVEAGSFMEGRTLLECGEQYPDIVFVALRHERDGFVPRPKISEQLEAGAVLIIAGKTSQVEAMSTCMLAKAA